MTSYRDPFSAAFNAEIVLGVSVLRILCAFGSGGVISPYCSWPPITSPFSPAGMFARIQVYATADRQHALMQKWILTQQDESMQANGITIAAIGKCLIRPGASSLDCRELDTKFPGTAVEIGE